MRRTIFGILGILLLAMSLTGCTQGKSQAQGEAKDLVVYVSPGATRVKEQALSYGLPVKTIDQASGALDLVQALFQSPTEDFYVVINPTLKRHVAAGAVSDQVNPSDTETLLRELKMASSVGVKTYPSLFAESGKAKVVVFSDYQCPYCKVMDETLPQWKAEFGDKLDVEMLNFPLPSHPMAFPAAEAAECVRAQSAEKLEAYQQSLFAHQEELSENKLLSLAKAQSVDVETFKQCLAMHQTRKKVRQDQYLGRYLGVNGTPFVFLNGKPMFGLSAQEIHDKVSESLGIPVKPSSAKP